MEPTDINRAAWDAIHRERRSARAALPPIVSATLGDLNGKRVLSLQAGTGEATAQLADLGAVVTGVDPVDAMLDEARGRWPSILWIRGEADALPREVRRGRFDLVYSPEGTLQRVPDLDAWTRGLVSALRDGGELLVYDDHPAALCLDAIGHWHYDYFAEGFWRLGQIVTALVRANFTIVALEEYPGQRRVPGTFLLYARAAS